MGSDMATKGKHKQGGAVRRYTRDEKYEAAVYMMIYGNMKTVSEMLNIHYQTIVTWVKGDPVFNECYEQAVENGKKKFDARTSSIIDKSLSLLDAKINKEFSLMKEGKGQMRVSEISKAMTDLFDRRQLVRNAPTSITERKTVEHLDELAKKFDEIANAKTSNESKELH